MPSVEWERSVQPKLAAIPDARVSFQSQSGGFSGRDITFVIGGDDPVALEKHALTIVDQMKGLNEIRSPRIERSEEHTSELQSLMRISYAVFCLKKKHNTKSNTIIV